jgi:hypothetical protein
MRQQQTMTLRWGKIITDLRYEKCFTLPKTARLFRLFFLQETGGGPEKSAQKTLFSFCLCARLSLFLQKTGGGSAKSAQKTLFSFCLCARLSLFLHVKNNVHGKTLIFPNFHNNYETYIPLPFRLPAADLALQCTKS